MRKEKDKQNNKSPEEIRKEISKKTLNPNMERLKYEVAQEFGLFHKNVKNDKY